jgi:hypothetical protein
MEQFFNWVKKNLTKVCSIKLTKYGGIKLTKMWDIKLTNYGGIKLTKYET